MPNANSHYEIFRAPLNICHLAFLVRYKIHLTTGKPSTLPKFNLLIYKTPKICYLSFTLIIYFSVYCAGSCSVLLQVYSLHIFLVSSSTTCNPAIVISQFL